MENNSELPKKNLSEVIKSAMSFNMDRVLERYKHYHNVNSEEAARHEIELKRFLILCSINPKETKYGIANPIDNLWHEFILFTNDYAKFCKETLGVFIHHKSRMPGKTRPEIEINQMHNQFLSDYKKCFNVEASSEYWTTNMECSHVEPTPEVE